MSTTQPEVWLRGPLPGIPALLRDFPGELLWTRPGGVTSAGFHLQHLSGVLDRLFTYARGESLTPAQLPSTVLGLLFHAAEHTQRHLGQLLVTVRVQRDVSPGA